MADRNGLPAASVIDPPAVAAPPLAEAGMFSADDNAPPPNWPDDAAESAFRAEARDRGEPVRMARETEDAADQPETDALPKLDELVARIPTGVREALEDLFRARFVAVKRVPKKALKP
jgi:hypothetical protein